MRWDEAFKNAEPDNQLAFLMREEKATELFLESKKWIDDNPEAWGYMASVAIRDFNRKGRACIKKCVEDTRFEKDVSIKNALSPYLARFLVSKHKCLDGAMRLHKSEADRFVYEFE